MSPQSGLLLILAIIAAALVVQTILLVVLMVSLRNLFGRIQTLVDRLSRGTEPVLKTAHEVIVESRDKIASVTASVDAIGVLAKSQMTRIDGFLKDTTERAQLQVLRLDELVGDTMNRVAQTTEAVQQGVLAPIREVSAIMAGVRASLDFLFRRSRKTVERATQDEELFI